MRELTQREVKMTYTKGIIIGRRWVRAEENDKQKSVGLFR
jgi:hypothetical protein